jgi:hypothetical protein
VSPEDPRHGTYAGGRVHRAHHQPVCDPCAYAEARYERARQLDILNGRPRSLPCLGTRRRLQALVALGHSYSRIGEALAMTPAGAWALGTRDRAYVRATTVAKVSSLYEAWSMLLPPETTTNERKAAAYARTVATKNSWLPPLAWDDIDHDPEPAAATDHGDVDWVVVERVLAGDVVPTTTAERRAIVTRWPETGRPYNDLARLTGWKVERYHQTQETAA